MSAYETVSNQSMKTKHQSRSPSGNVCLKTAVQSTVTHNQMLMSNVDLICVIIHQKLLAIIVFGMLAC